MNCASGEREGKLLSQYITGHLKTECRTKITSSQTLSKGPLWPWELRVLACTHKARAQPLARHREGAQHTSVTPAEAEESRSPSATQCI